jgi:hypothetical protein
MSLRRLSLRGCSAGSQCETMRNLLSSSRTYMKPAAGSRISTGTKPATASGIRLQFSLGPGATL